MSEYLDALIKALEAEADEQRCELDRSSAKGFKEPKRIASQLKRSLQRLDSLKRLRAAEAVKSPIQVRPMGKTARKRRSEPSHSQEAGAP